MEDNIKENWKKFLNEEMTKAQELGITEFPYIEKDSRGNKIYYEDSNKSWYKQEFDLNNRVTFYEDSDECWYKKEFDLNSNVIYYETSNGCWYKKEFDLNSKEIYFENSDKLIIDNRPKSTPEYTMEELTQMLGKEFKIKK